MRPSRSKLRARWIGEGDRIEAIKADLREHRDWTRHLFASTSGFSTSLRYVETCRRKAFETQSAPRDLRGIPLANVDLSETVGLADADLDYALFENVSLYKASLRASSLVGAIFRGSTYLNEAIFERAKLNRADCREISLNGADLRQASLGGCDFRGADLRNALFTGATIKEEGTFGFLSFRQGWTKFGGELQSFDDLHSKNSLRLRKHIARSSNIESLKKERPLYAWFFWLFANYGRSAPRFGLFAFVGCWLFFAVAYASLAVPAFLRDTPLADWLDSVRPQFVLSSNPTTPTSLSLADAMYLSAVTITTLGYGDVVPAAGNGMARLLVGAEAISGVIILGAFINMLVQNAVVEGD